MLKFSENSESVTVHAYGSDAWAPGCAAGALVDRLASGEKKVAVWGMGYLGYHNLVRLLARRLPVVATDRLRERLDQVGAQGFVGQVLQNLYGYAMSESLQGWAPVEVADEFALGRRTDVGVHLICVHAEKDDRPSDEPLVEVLESIAEGCAAGADLPVLAVIESFTVPGVVDRVAHGVFRGAGLTIGRDVCVGVAPRLDYGRSPFAGDGGQVRVVGGVTPTCREMLTAFYRLMGETVRMASSPLQAEMACAVHRGAQHLLLSYANQLALGFGHADMTEVMDLAAALGGMGLSRPGLGSSGYFLPLSAHHLRSSARDPELLTLLEETFRCDLMMAGVVADRVMGAGVRQAAILGLATQVDVKNHVRSASEKLASVLRSRGGNPLVCDPMYTEQEIGEITQCHAGVWPADLRECDGVVLATAHHLFRATGGAELARQLRPMKLVLDCTGAWADKGLDAAGVNYFALGQPGWDG